MTHSRRPVSTRAPRAWPGARSSPITVTMLLLPLLVFITACGVPLDGSAREISFVSTTSTTTTVADTTTVRSSDGENGVIYYADEKSRLRSKKVRLDELADAGEPGPAVVEEAIDELLDAETPEDLKSRIPSGTRLLDLRVSEDRVIVDLSEEMGDIVSPFDRVAYAQLVFTVLQFDTYREVTFEIEGSPVDAPTDDGNHKVVTAQQYVYPLRPTGSADGDGQ